MLINPISSKKKIKGRRKKKRFVASRAAPRGAGAARRKSREMHAEENQPTESEPVKAHHVARFPMQTFVASHYFFLKVLPLIT
jgi:hypothetical protein